MTIQDAVGMSSSFTYDELLAHSNGHPFQPQLYAL
jgi:hypothetical protein